MNGFRLSPDAANDIQQIWKYIATDSANSASKVRLSILQACQRLGANPHLGHYRRDLTDLPVRFWPVGAYLIVYTPEVSPVLIVRVL
jgi:antitoxin ParD1/3/4/toxin ParE1/3/4